MKLGVSCKRLSGWTPRTTYHYDDFGRVAFTEVESEWDAYERALIDAYLDYKGDLHTCGHPLTDALHQAGRDATESYRAGFLVCDACLALDRAMRVQGTADKKITDSGGTVATDARIWQVSRR